MELLIMKNNNEYVRVKEDAYLFVGLDKASVFPLEKIDVVLGHINNLQARGFDHVSIYRLKLSEEPYIQ
ncbi:MAG: hypothetical protein HN366_16015 [Deltaproteobacteria bacterium]|jgi:hypothetical protein|nr:hypothetical protein [Deltaproteobacteria bacterium]